MFRILLLTLLVWLIGLWAVLAIYALASDFEVGTSVTVAMCAIAAYIVGSDAAIRLARSLRA